MNVSEFHKLYPHLLYRVIVKKEHLTVDEHLSPNWQINIIHKWCADMFGPRLERWGKQPQADPYLHAYWFSTEEDATMFALRWV